MQQKGYNDVITSNKNDVAERFMFNGKENNPELGLQWYDFGARNYDAALGRWMNIDPLADNYFSFSTYNYTLNNPVFFIDPDGRAVSDHTGYGSNSQLSGTGDLIMTNNGESNSRNNPISSYDGGIVTKYEGSNTIIVEANFIFYGNTNNANIDAIKNEISSQYNSAGSTKSGVPATITMNNKEYTVLFAITAQFVSESEAIQLAANNTSPLNNFIRLEEGTRADRSFMSGLGTNSGVWYLSDKLGTSTTGTHEAGHGFGLDHSDGDQRGNGVPDIMAARGTLVDSEFQWNPNAVAGQYGGTIKPEFRQVLQSNISLIFSNLNFGSQQTINIGTADNIIYDQNGNPK